MSTKNTNSAIPGFVTGVQPDLSQTTFQMIPKEYVRAMRRIHQEKLEQERLAKPFWRAFWQ